MRSNKRRDSSAEMALRLRLHRAGARYRVDLPISTGSLRVRPDLVFAKRRIAVFVDGCYWHSCPLHGHIPATNSDYWTSKFARNRERDAEQTAALQEAGWHVIRIWEHEAVDAAAELVLAAIAAHAKERAT